MMSDQVSPAAVEALQTKYLYAKYITNTCITILCLGLFLMIVYFVV